MPFKNSILIAATLGLAAAPVAAQTAPEAPAATAEQEQTMARAGLIFSLFANAVKVDEIPEAEKDALIGCLYANTLETISQATGNALAENPQIDGSDPTNVYLVAAIVCGAREAGATPSDAPATAPADPSAEPATR